MNIFEAQAAYYMQKGYNVAVLISPISNSHRASNKTFWNNFLNQLSFAPDVTVDYGRAHRRLKPYRSWLYWKWRINGRGSAMKIMATYAGEAKLPPSILSFIQRHHVKVVHANHSFQMLAAQNILEIAISTGSAPKLVVDTHDFQAENFFNYENINPFSKERDDLDLLVKDEAALYSAADTILHLTESDLRALKPLNPMHKHFVTTATLSPARERTIKATRSENAAGAIDFLFVGDAHHGNFVSLRWMLEKVFSLINFRNYNIKIVGRVEKLFRNQAATECLYSRFGELFVGEVEDLEFFYRNSCVVLSPAVIGTGSSIKLIEALAMGKAIVTNPKGLRGMPLGIALPDSIVVAESPEEFLDGMLRLRSHKKNYWHESVLFYNEYFSNLRYFKDLDNAIFMNADKCS